MVGVFVSLFVFFWFFEELSRGSFGLTENGNLSQGTETLLPVIASPMLRGLLIVPAGWMSTSPRHSRALPQRARTIF